MKILFLQKDVFARLAIMLFSTLLKEQGHQCDVLVDDLEKNLVQKALEINPDIIAFSITTGEYAWMDEIGKQIRQRFKKLLICGGAHPTFYPDIINEEYLDVICVGEGEGAIIDLVKALAKGEEIININNLYVKKDGKIYKNNVRPLVEDLDSNPFPDRKIYDKYAFHRDVRHGVTGKDIIETNRGCPYHCTFCFNKQYHEIYKGKGKFLRRRSVANVIEELEQMKSILKKRKFILFNDDIFTLPPKTWVNQFLDEYREKINYPFLIQTRADLIDGKLIKKLKDANCFSIKMSIESGNEYVRNTILKKNLTNKQIINAANLIKKHGILLQAFNIIGNPGETLEMALETFEFAKRINPAFATCALLKPYPGTEIYNYAVENGYLRKKVDFDEWSYSIYTGSQLKMKNRKEIMNLQRLFSFGVFLRLPTKLMRILIKLPFTRLFDLLFGVSYMWGVTKIHKQRLAIALKVTFSVLAGYVL